MSIPNQNSSQTIRSYDILVNASLNLLQLGIQADNAGFRSFRSFRDVICDHKQLEQFLIARKSPSRSAQLLSRHLCLLERKHLYHLFDVVQENIDFAPILEQLSLILHSVNLNEHQRHVDNIITMITTIEQANIFRSLSALRNTSWMYDIPKLFTALRSGDIDMITLLKVFSDLEPIFNTDDLHLNDHSSKLSEMKQQKQLDFVMQFYNMDDSSLTNAVNVALSVASNQSTIEHGPNKSNGSDYDYEESGDDDQGKSTPDSDSSQTNRPSLRSTGNVHSESLSRKLLPKLLANMDRFIDGIEKFTRTQQWESLISAFQGLQMMLEMGEESNHETFHNCNKTTKFESINIEKVILSLPKKIQAFNNFFNSMVPEKFQHLVYPLFNLFYRMADTLLQHLSGAFSRALAEDKIFYFDKFAQLLLDSLANGTIPRKCGIVQEAMCNLDVFQSVFVYQMDEETNESTKVFDASPETLQGIQELGCLFFGRNYSQPESEESMPILAKLYYTLSTLNDTNKLADSLSSDLSSVNDTTTDNTSLTNFTSRMLEVYLLATKSVNANTWDDIFHQINRIWKSNGMIDRVILVSRVLQLSVNCFIPERIIDSPIWRMIYRKNIIANEVINVVLNEITDMADAESLKVSQLSMGSATLHHFLTTNLRALPPLIDALVSTVFTNLPHFVEKMMQFYPNLKNGWPCNHNSLLDVITLTDQSQAAAVYQIEDFLCKQARMSKGHAGRIVDELIEPSNNESRIASLIQVVQSKSTDPKLIHEHLPPLDWVEAAQGLSFIKESIQKMIFMDNSLVLFPEVDQLDGKIKESFSRGHSSFLNFYTQGNVGLMAYLGDIVTPLVIRHLALNETFSETCDYGVTGTLMAPVYNDKEWRCSFVSLRYASYTLKQLFDTLNRVLENALALIGKSDEQTTVKEREQQSSQRSSMCNWTKNGSGSINLNLTTYTLVLDNIPEVVQLMLNEIMLGNMERLASYNGSGLFQMFCSSNLNLDTFGSKREMYDNIRRSMCSFTQQVLPCFSFPLPEQWFNAFETLNATWYNQSPETLTDQASFTQAYQSVRRFFDLFGHFSPKYFNKFLDKFSSADGQDYVREVLRRMNRMDHFRNKRFVYVMQTISKEVNEAIFESSKLPKSASSIENKRDTLIALIYMLNDLPARLRQRYKLGAIHVTPSSNASSTVVDDEMINADLLDALLDWLDSHLLVASETFLQTITLDKGKLLKLFQNRHDTATVWRSLCRSPVSQHFVVDTQISVSANKAKEEICRLNFNTIYDQWYRRARPLLSNHTNQELVSTLLIKVGTILDLVMHDAIYKRDLLKSNEWQPILSKLGRLVLSSSNSPHANNSWILQVITDFVQTSLSPKSAELLHDSFARLSCGMETVSTEGLNWELVPRIYRNKTDIMSLYATLNSVFAVGSVGLNTFLMQSKFYNFLQLWTKPGKVEFCHLQTEQDFNNVFAIVPSSANDALVMLKNVQSLLCESDKSIVFHMNPVSQCYAARVDQRHDLGDKMKSLHNKLSVLFAKNSVHSEASLDSGEVATTAPILDMKQWSQFFKWWSQEVSPYPNSGITLLTMRSFQLIDALAENHVIWKAFYRLTFITSEMLAYSLRVLQLSESMYPIKSDVKFMTDKLKSLTTNSSSSGTTSEPQQQFSNVSPHRSLSSLLTSTVSNLIFPEVNHFITFATFRQLRWIRQISHFFAQHPDILHEELCPTLNSINHQRNSALKSNVSSSPVIVDDDFNDLLLLLCHNHPSDWIYTLTFKSNLFNIKAAPRPKFMSHRRIRERIGKLTQVLARMLDYNSNKNDEKLDNVVKFLKLKQLESIENVAATATIFLETVSMSQNKTIKNATGSRSTIRDLLNTGWRSVPTLLDTVDQYICSYRKSDLTRTKLSDDFAESFSSDFMYLPKAPDMKVVMCEMPRWDFDQAYTYLSKHLDLKNMLLVFASSDVVNSIDSPLLTSSDRCVTPLRFLSRWLNVGQDIFEQVSSSSFWSNLKACRRRHLLQVLASSKSKSNTFLLKNSLRYVRFMNGLLSTIDKFSKENNGISWSNVRELWKTFSYFVLNQVPAYVPITDIIRHDVNLSEYLNSTLDRISTLNRSRAKQAIRLLTDSLLNINAVSWNNFSNIAMKEMICKEQTMLNSKNSLPIIISQSKLNQSVESISHEQSLYETLCQTGNSNQIIDSLFSVLDHKNIHHRLSELKQSELARTQWISDVFMPEMTELSSEMITSGMFNDIGSKIGLFSNANPEMSSQKGINHFLISFVSLTRAKNFNTLYDTIKHIIDKLMPRFNEGQIVNSLSRILEGLKSLKDLSNQGLFQIKCKRKMFFFVGAQ